MVASTAVSRNENSGPARSPGHPDAARQNDSGVGASPAVIIFQADDIVFTEVVAALHFDDVHRLVAGIGNAMDVTNGDIGRFIRRQIELFLVSRESRETRKSSI